MEQLKGLSPRPKARLISFALIVAYLLYGVLAYAWDVREMTPEIEYVESFPIFAFGIYVFFCWIRFDYTSVYKSYVYFVDGRNNFTFYMASGSFADKKSV
ncbi:MAG: hypothetical protein E7289_10455 [Lachnospiraceae bacterium]|nr:hypothetical protein [Lachnospiraceae bacterium]